VLDNQNILKILLVVAEQGVHETIRGELPKYGFGCQTATDSEQALRLLREHDFDFLIADVSTPQVNGLDLLAHVRQYAPGCKVILIMGTSERKYLAQALMLGAYDFLETPYDIQELLRVVRNAADEPTLSKDASSFSPISPEARKAALDGVQALIRAVEAKDRYTHRHSEQVAFYATQLAREMKRNPKEIEAVHVAGLLHDLGKIGLPDYILTKSGTLTLEEFHFVQKHPALGADILSNITVFEKEAQLVRHHHERWDGNGYPDRLSHEEIPLGSRIIHVADSMDAMLMDRSYKSGCSVDAMVDELIRCSGSDFDPSIASTSVKWCRQHPDLLRYSEPSPKLSLTTFP
jgi:putative nucleotidyltransferase with HDIG domain